MEHVQTIRRFTNFSGGSLSQQIARNGTVLTLRYALRDEGTSQ